MPSKEINFIPSYPKEISFPLGFVVEAQEIKVKFCC